MRRSPGKPDPQTRHIKYLQCELPGHESEPLSRVCIGKDCQNKTLVCSICEEDNHCGHQTVPLK